MELTWTRTLRKEFGHLSDQRILWLLRLITHGGKAEKLLVAQSRIFKCKRRNIQIMCLPPLFCLNLPENTNTLSLSRTNMFYHQSHRLLLQMDFLRKNMYHRNIFICGIFNIIVSAEAQDWISMKIEVALYSKGCSLILGQSRRKANTQEQALMVIL